MNPYIAYQKQEVATGWTRIDLLLALYDKALERLDRAEAAIAAENQPEATNQLIKTQLILAALVSGVRGQVNVEQTTNILRLYEYVSHELRQPRTEGIINSRKVLTTLRQGFEAIRGQANELERSGRLAASESLAVVHTTA